MTRTETAIVFPLLPGKRPDLTQFVETLANIRQAEHDEVHQSVAYESWFLQATPQGDKVIVYLETPDPIEVFAELAVSQKPFQIWFRAQVQELCGVDLTVIPPFELPERIFHRIRG